MDSSGQGCQRTQPSNILVQMKRCSSFLLNYHQEQMKRKTTWVRQIFKKIEQGVQHNLLQRITRQVICIMNPKAKVVKKNVRSFKYHLVPYKKLLNCSPSTFFLKNFANFTGKRLCWSLFLIKFRPSGLIKKCFQDSSFGVKFARFLRIPISQNICERLLLYCIRFCYLFSLS